MSEGNSLIKTWILSTKEKGNESITFKANKKESKNKSVYKIELKEDNQFTDYSSADNKIITRKGNYKIKGNFLTLYFKNSYEDVRYQITHIDEDTLKLKRMFSL